MSFVKNKGFTLIEILLVIGVIMIMSIIKIRDINEENENMQSKMLASQIKTVADATNAFLVLKYNELSVLSSPGISCNTGTGTCNITLQNLSDESLLPPNFNNNTIFGNPYEIQLKRTGNAPNYMLSGLVLTKGNKNSENTSAFVFLGKVLSDIGRDGGLNKTSGKIIGTANGWSADSALFPVLSGKTGYVGSAVGTLSGAYYVYLRRDGTLPMTGDLNMDGHNIKNVNNLTAKGEIKTSGDILSKNITASSNIYGDNLIMTGNINSSGRISSGEYMYISGIVNPGGLCEKNGLQGRNSQGKLLSCVDKKWEINDIKSGFFKAPPPQTIKCSGPKNNGNGISTYHAKIDESGQIYTMFTSNFGVNTSWIKGVMINTGTAINLKPNFEIDFSGMKTPGCNAYWAW